ncbi:MAG: NfeD family protein [Anaerolineae bacterium]|nr:hypothetical protein [Anaerolineae bacterium]MDW8069623.1 NfeD family protein [Anaerolineae bacterium]
MGGDWLTTLQEFLTNPNVAYIFLLLGLWALAAAWTIPGTGFPEAAAVICLLLAAMGLARLPINSIGLGILLAALVLFLVDLKVQSGGLTVAAVIGLVVGSVLLFRPGEGVALSPWVVAGAAAVSAALFGWVFRLAMRAQRMAARTGPQTLVGAEGVATTPIDPTGTVQVRSELWTAVADTPIPAGTPVRVVAVEGLRVHVVPLGERPGTEG